MTIDSTITQLQFNDNFLQETKFSVTITNLPFATYFCQELKIPGVSTSEIPIENPFSRVYRAGDHLEYDYFTMSFLVDEDLVTWEETYNWLKGITFPHDFEEYRKQKAAGIYHDAIVTLHTNTNLDNVRFKFTNCAPVALSEMRLTYAGDAKQRIICELTLRYDTFIFERLQQNT